MNCRPRLSTFVPFLQPPRSPEPTTCLPRPHETCPLQALVGWTLPSRACAWSHQALTYEYGVTNVRTNAATALGGGKGVCQDYAHVMLALCRAAGLPARYVSGHMVGEGGSHAWVEVVVSDPSAQATGRAVAVAFDPTHNRRASQGYFTVAVGRDYDHVAPTSGTFEGAGPSVLSARKRLVGRTLTRPLTTALFVSGAAPRAVDAHRCPKGTLDRRSTVVRYP